MKKLLAAALFALLGTGAFAQTSQGTVVVTGNFSLRASTSDYTVKDTLNRKSNGVGLYIGPSVGYMLGGGFELGTALGYFHSTYKDKYFNSEGDSYEIKTKSNTFSIGPYLKKHFMISEQFALTGQFSTVLGVRKKKSDDPADSQPKDIFFNAALAPGITYFPTDKLGISAGLGGLRYEQSSKKTEAGGTPINKNSGFKVSFEDALYFSLSYYLNR
ncbi:outer membrane protein with beta-barrel domain [Pontibacter mucosus]|uniref:Outer membrane protein with beta-barrel domain n=1 Tax=Pontibacter mucosus TaxID=1649266 RepID=A0A2T5YGN1_9BACT|nr:outer membrane beta-barrel protein [Pontibacter mucosus]PTX18463.1 outer membrane protein with beta-barrel domain [Pontibacter mucosus]